LIQRTLAIAKKIEIVVSEKIGKEKPPKREEESQNKT